MESHTGYAPVRLGEQGLSWRLSSHYSSSATPWFQPQETSWWAEIIERCPEIEIIRGKVTPKSRKTFKKRIFPFRKRV